MSHLSPSREAEPTLCTAHANAELLTTFGRGMLVTGDIVCAGAVQVFGWVQGDIRAAHLVIGEGGHVEGAVVVKEAVIQGHFKGAIHANSVKLQGRAVVEGEIYNKSLAIEENVVFDGVSRRIAQLVEAPRMGEIGKAAAAIAAGRFEQAVITPSREIDFDVVS